MPKLPPIDYQNLFQSLPGQYIGFLPNDPDFTIAVQSDAHAKISLVARNDTIGKPLFEVYPDTSPKYKKTGVSDLVESFRKVIKTGEPDTMETLRYDLRRPDGSLEVRYWQVTHYPLFDKDGKLSLIYQNTVDITPEMAVGKRLEQTQKQLDQALSVGSIGTWVWDIPADKVIVDENLSHMFGISPVEGAAGLPLETFVSAIHEADRPRIEAAIDKTLAQKTIFENECRIVSKDGTPRWVIARGRVEGDDKGKAVSFSGVVVDISERKLAESNLSFMAKASAVLSTSLDYKKTLQTIADLIVPDIADWCTVQMFDKDRVLQQVALAHKDPKKVKWARELYKTRGQEDLDDATGVAKVIRTGKAEYYPEITDEMLVATAKSKAELKLTRSLGLSSVIMVPITTEDETVGVITLISAEQKRHYTIADLDMAEQLASRASLAINNANLYEESQHDLRERKRLQKELREANKDLESRVNRRTAELQTANTGLQRSNQELEGFAYVASHDLQEPLRKIQAFSNLLEEEYAAQLGDGSDYLARMRSAAIRMSSLIDDLLSFSRVTTKAREFTAVDLETVVHDVINDLETRIRETKGKVTTKNLPTIQADPMQMRQLFQNLLANALKFHRPDVPPKVKITAKPSSKGATIQQCTIEVTDNGVGFDEKYLDRIFAVFQRLHGRESYEGTGIGLAVCRKIVERHDGTITAKSAVGKGASFIITLPLNATVKE